ncbi:HAD-IA family hydrolase [Candidatus Vallotia tarda]|uniref:Phosphoglycolate phosphatase n=1 Tax=Candidatus Vallotiella hemipterorum TaxID=1177213 RepID=A0A916JU34_9BURK|nr:HAD-IA family hydrolase [Candidatus Vallotia tarda]CAG7598467.1 Phosphoglycolate phosphatase [Candidatus Vallotia tarda]
MARKQFDLIVFDWDGTLIDSITHITRSIQLACRDLNFPVPDSLLVSYIIGLELHNALQIAVPTLDPSQYFLLAERYRFYYLSSDLHIKLFAGVREMLDELCGADYLLAIATGKSRVGLNRALDLVRLRTIFHATRCADESFSKPHPAMLYELTQELGQTANRTLMIGDTTHDLQMAANAGIAAVAVSYGAHSAERLTKLKPHFCAEDVESLVHWLREC